MPSCVWVRVPSLAQKEAVGIPTAYFCASLGLTVSFPSVTNVTSPQGEFTSPTFGRSLSHRSDGVSRDHLFCASFGRTLNECGGLLPPGRAARIPLIINALGIFRVVKTSTLISVKHLIHSHLQVTLQLRGHWRYSRGQLRGTAESTSKRIRGDTYHIVAATVSQEMQAAISSQLPGIEHYAQSRAVYIFFRII